MKIKFSIGDKVYLYDSADIIETTIKGVDIKETGITYKVDGYYHNKHEEFLFANINDLLEDLKTRVSKPKSLSEKAKSMIKG